MAVRSGGDQFQPPWAGTVGASSLSPGVSGAGGRNVARPTIVAGRADKELMVCERASEPSESTVEASTCRLRMAHARREDGGLLRWHAEDRSEKNSL